MNKDSLLTEKDASHLLGLKQRTLQRWRLSGRGPRFIRMSGRIVRYRHSDVLSWIAGRESFSKQE